VIARASVATTRTRGKVFHNPFPSYLYRAPFRNTPRRARRRRGNRPSWRCAGSTGILRDPGDAARGHVADQETAFLVRVRTNLPAAIIGAAYAGAAHLPVAVRPCTIVIPVARYRARRPRGVCHEHQPPGAPRAGRRTILAPAWACN